MMKRLLLTVAIVAAIVVSSANRINADTLVITVNPNGTPSPSIAGVATIDEAPGNALAVGVIPFSGAPILPGTNFTLLYQARVATLNDLNGMTLFAFTPGTGQMTVVAALQETVVSSTGTNITFAHVAGTPNVIKFYANSTATANDLTGLGFTDGTNILTATVIDSSGNFALSATNPGPVQFDQFGVNNYPGVTTLVGSGSTLVTADVTSVNSAFFPDLTPSSGISLTLLNANTSNNTPFLQVNPSAQFSKDAMANGGTPHDIGTVNGVTGPNFQFQADANSSFQAVASVPEPASLALLAVGACGFGLARTIRRRKA